MVPGQDVMRFSLVKSIEALVVSHNEAHLLVRSLPTVSFCDVRTLIDLQSSDTSQQVGEMHGFNVLVAENRGAVEAIHETYLSQYGEDWVLFLDPDEEITAPLAEHIQSFRVRGLHDTSIGGYSARWKFYFKGKPIENGPWSGGTKTFLVRKEAFVFQSVSHQGKVLRDGFQIISIVEGDGSYIRHNWASSWAELFKKHGLYLKLIRQGRGRMNAGRPLLNALFQFRRQSAKAFLEKNAHHDGVVGFLLGIFWVGYQTLAMYFSTKAYAAFKTSSAPSSAPRRRFPYGG